jgi:hypothetical protein
MKQQNQRPAPIFLAGGVKKDKEVIMMVSDIQF